MWIPGMYVDLAWKRLIVRFGATLFSFERPRSGLWVRLFYLVGHGSARTLKSA
jgi:hypothetical protein